MFYVDFYLKHMKIYILIWDLTKVFCNAHFYYKLNLGFWLGRKKHLILYII